MGAGSPRRRGARGCVAVVRAKREINLRSLRLVAGRGVISTKRAGLAIRGPRVRRPAFDGVYGFCIACFLICWLPFGGVVRVDSISGKGSAGKVGEGPVDFGVWIYALGGRASPRAQT